MTSNPAPTLFGPQQGSALVLVLGVLVLLTTAAATVVSLSTRVQISRNQRSRIMTLDTALPAAEDMALVWLEQHAPGAVLPIEAPHPAFAAGTLQGPLSEDTVRIRLTAYDQDAMLSPETIRDAPRMLQGLPRDIQRDVKELAQVASALPSIPDRLDLVRHTPFVPAGLESTITLFGDGTAFIERPDPKQLWNSPLAFLRLSGAKDTLNISTAPEGLVKAALGYLDIDALDLIQAARSKGEKPSLGQMQSDGAGAGSLQLVTTSSSWAFRIDLQVATVSKSWWCVYVRRGPKWVCDSRRVLPH